MLLFAENEVGVTKVIGSHVCDWTRAQFPSFPLVFLQAHWFSTLIKINFPLIPSGYEAVLQDHTCIIKELQDAHMQFWPYLDELRPSKLQPGNARKGDLQASCLFPIHLTKEVSESNFRRGQTGEGNLTNHYLPQSPWLRTSKKFLK